MNSEIAERIAQALPGSQVEVNVEGNRAFVRVVSHAFANMTRVQRHQAVYGCIEEFIASGALHAVSINAEVP